MNIYPFSLLRKIFFTLVLLYCSIAIFAQAPGKFQYQSVFRNNNGDPLTSEITLRFSVHEETPDGTIVFQETHTITPNQYGLVSLQIGGGTPVIATLNDVNWGEYSYFLQVEMNDGSGYLDMGTTEFISVPYALHAQTVEENFNFIITGITDISINRGDSVSLPIYIHWIDGEQESVSLTASNIPEGVSIEFENDSVTPNFGTSIKISTTLDASQGTYTMSLVATAENGKTKTYPVVLDIISVLSAELEILDATTWSVENPLVDVAQGATVKVYASQLAFNSNTPDYTAISDENGIARLYDISGGEDDKYYYTVEDGELKNTVNGLVIAGVFQDQAEIDSWPWQSGAYIGGLKYRDLNGDGMINVQDGVFAPWMYINSGELTNLTVYIGKEDSTAQSFYIETESALIDSLDAAIHDFHNFVEFSYLFDAIYTNNIAAPSTAWNDVYNHTVTAASDKVSKLWFDGFELIRILNKILASSDRINLPIEQSNHFTGVTRQLRGFIYFTLLNWFGGSYGLPIYTDFTETNNSRATTMEVLNFIISDLEEANALLSNSGESNSVTKGFALSLMALVKMDISGWASSYSNANEVINSAQFALTVSDSIYTQSSSETIYGFTKSSNTEFSSAFTFGNFVPVNRFAETLLAAATASLEMGNIETAAGYINLLRSRSGLSPLASGLSASELREEIYQQWIIEFNIEGNTLRTMKFFDKASSELGIDTWKLILPIPLEELNNNPYMTQNPGY